MIDITHRRHLTNPIGTRHAWSATRCSAALLALHSPACAQDSAWPTKPSKVVVTFLPGGSADAILRAIGPHVSATLGPPLVIETRPGAGGNIGLALVAEAEGDGFSLGLSAAGVLWPTSVRTCRCPSIR